MDSKPLRPRTSYRGYLNPWVGPTLGSPREPWRTQVLHNSLRSAWSRNKNGTYSKLRHAQLSTQLLLSCRGLFNALNNSGKSLVSPCHTRRLKSLPLRPTPLCYETLCRHADAIFNAKSCYGSASRIGNTLRKRKRNTLKGPNKLPSGRRNCPWGPQGSI